MTEPRVGSITRGTRTIGYLEWGPPSAVALVLLHPNGFCAGVFDPLARRLGRDRRIIGVDLCGHGASSPPESDDDLGYDSMAADVISVIDGIESACVLGSSLGGGVAIEVARRASSVIDSVMLCEAIAFPAMGAGPGPGNPIAETARRRRRTFSDREAALARYSDRSPLDELAPECLAGYVRWGFRDTDDGTVELACDPETEATLFTTSTDRYGGGHAFDRIEAIEAPVRVLAGETTYLPREWFELQADRAGTALELVAGGHFFLFEDIDRGVALIDDWLQSEIW